MMPLLAESIRPRNRVKVRGRPSLEDTVFLRNGVSPSFFETLGVGLVAGRTFDAGVPSEVVVSRAAAKLLPMRPSKPSAWRWTSCPPRRHPRRLPR